MNAPVDPYVKLVKILKLEQQQGYHDRAVIGGMARFATEWEKEAQALARNSQQAALARDITALLIGYTAIPDQETRKAVIEEILRRVRDNVPEAFEQVEGRRGRAAKPEPPPAPPMPTPVQEPTRPTARRAVPEAPPDTGLDAPVTQLPGVGPVHAKRLQKLGIRTVGDLLQHFPRRYVNYATLKPIGQLRVGEQVTIIGNVWDFGQRKTRGGKTLVHAIVSDASGSIQATWFNPYVIRQLTRGKTYAFSGKVDAYLGRLVMMNPEWEPVDRELINTGRLVPVYPLTKNMSQRWLRRLIKRTVDAWAPRLEDYLPESIREEWGLMPLSEAYQHIHFPESEEKLQAARRRLIFDELLFLQLGILRQRHLWRSRPGIPLEVHKTWLDTFFAQLPFQLTRAQERALQDILDDIQQPAPMSRLLQGDVGSGKTVVAAAAMWIAACNRAQAALMAPTEILAEQHYRNLQKLLGELTLPDGEPLRVALLTGRVRGKERDALLEDIAAGRVHIVVGTHALIQSDVAFHRLALGIVDEQHRFGVEQRAALRSKGHHPHLLVMSATPIPRTLALTLYGDLDLSVIDELPPGRQPVLTRWLKPTERERAYAFIKRQIEEGRQAFIIYPLVEGEDEDAEEKAAVNAFRRLQKEVFPRFRLGLLHGRLKGEEKDRIMRAFAAGELDILVSTSVVEVGIDVPNASVIMIESAERFGLAQLHQFRGRVGRGEHKSYCILISEGATPEAVERLRAMEQIHDGFKLAEKDLELRGPGDFFGTRQSGLPPLRLARLSDTRILEAARKVARRLYEEDPELRRPEHRPLAQRVRAFWERETDLS
ncbi:MAG: ATP-dependent DNA helicase RecG [Chloroflexi bacterium]|nr:ATP-dependent DNA helicase RecG [Chloroflexota bacterium]